jgi:hypothetical protein
MNAGIFGGGIATQEFATGLSQLGTDGSNPSLASGESADFWFLSADSGGSRSRIRDDLAQQSDLISLGVPGGDARYEGFP